MDVMFEEFVGLIWWAITFNLSEHGDFHDRIDLEQCLSPFLKTYKYFIIELSSSKNGTPDYKPSEICLMDVKKEDYL